MKFSKNQKVSAKFNDNGVERIFDGYSVRPDRSCPGYTICRMKERKPGATVQLMMIENTALELTGMTQDEVMQYTELAFNNPGSPVIVKTPQLGMITIQYFTSSQNFNVYKADGQKLYTDIRYGNLLDLLCL